LPNVTATLKKALGQLRSQRASLDRQIEALEGALASLGGSAARRPKGERKAAKKAARNPARRAARKMTSAQRRAVSRRMKAYWAQRRKAKTAAAR
jgi:hypothetical protein